jgi:alkanesulfonate monooxygenase
LIEYTTIIRELLAGASAVTYHGKFYSVERLKLMPPLPQELFPGFFLSGSSEAGLAAARALGATVVKYPQPASAYETAPHPEISAAGIRVGIIAREDVNEAWAIARARFPEDRKGQLTHQLAMKVSDSAWHQQLSEMHREIEHTPYWLVPFQNYQTFCPYLVGSYTQVSGEFSPLYGTWLPHIHRGCAT